MNDTLASPPSSPALGLLTSERTWQRHGAAWRRLAVGEGRELFAVFPGASTRAPADTDAAEIAFFSRDLYDGSTLAQAGPRSRAFFAAATASRRLRWLQVCSSGLDLPDYQEFLRHADAALKLSTGAGVMARPIALNVLTAILAMERNFPFWLKNQQGRRWQPQPRDTLPREIESLRAVVVGTGALGTQIARLLRGVGMHVSGVRRHAADHADFDRVCSTSQLDDLLPQCDWLVLACPATCETRGMVDARRLSLLAPGAGLANVARGSVVDEAALVEALTQGRLAQAYLDVFETEPLPPGSPLWAMPKVWVTPHNAAASAGHEDRVADLFGRNLRLWLRGEPLVNAATLR